MIKFNVGCGKRDFGQDWYHVDGGNYPHLDGCYVTLKYTPDNYIDLLYSSHLIAYFDRDEAAALFAGWFKKIKPGGVLRLATPNIELLSYLYMYYKDVTLLNIIGPMYGKMKMGNNTIYHKTGWDLMDLTIALTNAGFIDVKFYDHCTTEHPNTGNREDKYDDHSAAYINGTLISLNLECKKPG